MKSIAIYADWNELPGPLRLGVLTARAGAGRETFEFTFDAAVLKHPHLQHLQLDPRLGLFEGAQYPAQNCDNFGVFLDASPDRWGRLLMRRRLEREQRAGLVDKAALIYESDYLLGVHDAFRAGALRFRLDDEGDFLDNRNGLSAPPLVALRALEAASLALENDEDNTDPQGDKWLRMLIAPGGSLGGARPKASVVDPQGRLWMAKFPSVRDEVDVGAWEMVVHTLAHSCGLQVPRSAARRFGSVHHTLMVERFDRTPSGRLHFASAMTLTGHQDADDAASGASYLEIARVLIDHGAQTEVDLRELWSRIVFNVLVSNTDDHLRNHGFILSPGQGWRLSKAYDMNPVPYAQGLKLNISEADNALDLELVRSVAPYFRVSNLDAIGVIERFKKVVALWPAVAASLQLSSREQERMAVAFE